jgi:hypothetical protein
MEHIFYCLLRYCALFGESILDNGKIRNVGKNGEQIMYLLGIT